MIKNRGLVLVSFVLGLITLGLLSLILIILHLFNLEVTEYITIILMGIAFLVATQGCVVGGKH